MSKFFKRKKAIGIVLFLVCVSAVFLISLYVYPKPDGDEKTQPEAAQDAGPAYTEEQPQDMAAENDNNDLIQDEKQDMDVVNDSNRLKDKKLSILGDSISTFDGCIPEGYAVFFPMSGEVESVDETWWKLLLDDTGMQLCANSSSSGSTCSGDSLSIDDPLIACSNYRIDDLIGKGGIYPDLIIVYMGTNDLLRNVPIGENDGTQTVEEGVIKTFSDAYTLILDKLESQYPGAQIFCCTLTQIGDWGTKQPFVTFVNTLDLTSEDYNKRIETIASNKSLTVIDLYNCGITIDNMPRYVTDGVHLNPAGMELIENVIKEAVAM